MPSSTAGPTPDLCTDLPRRHLSRRQAVNLHATRLMALICRYRSHLALGRPSKRRPFTYGRSPTAQPARYLIGAAGRAPAPPREAVTDLVGLRCRRPHAHIRWEGNLYKVTD